MAVRHLVGALLTASATLLSGVAAPLVTAAPALAAAPSSAPAPGATQPAAFGIQAATKGRPDARSQLTYSLTPRARLADQVAIVNIGDRPETLTVYATDAVSGKDGSFALLPAATKPTEIGSWVTLQGSHSVSVPARTSRGPSYVIVPFTIAVPANATPGDHVGAIVVSLTGTAVNPQGVKIRLDQRIGLRIYARVSGKLIPRLSVDGLHFHYTPPGFLAPFGDGSATVSYRVQNTGNVVLGATQDVSVSSWFGSTVHLENLPIVPPLLPGGSVTISRRVTGIYPGGHITASVRLTPVAPPGGADPGLAPVSRSATTWAFPWLLVIVAALLLAGLGFLLWLRLRPRPQPSPANTSHRRSAVVARTGGKS